MAMKEAFLTKPVAKKLESFTTADDDSGILLLFGWISDRIGHCIGCSRLTDDFEEISSLFPSGLFVVGIYVKSADDQTVATVTMKAKEFYETRAKLDIHEITERGYMVVLSNSSRHAYKCECYIYECSENTLTHIPLKVFMTDTYPHPSSVMTARITGSLPISFEVGKTKADTLANFDEAFTNARKKLFARTCKFYFKQTSILLSPGESNQPTNQILRMESTCKELIRCFLDENEDDDTELMDKSKKKKKQTKSNKQEMMSVKLLFQTTGIDAENETVSTAPVIYYEKRDVKCASFYANIDVIASIPNSILISKLPSIFANKVAAQLSVIGKLVKHYLYVHGTPYTASAHHFKSPYTDHIITVVYPDNIHDEKLENVRKKIHMELLLPMDRPLIRKSMKLILNSEPSSGSYLQNVHIGLQPSGVARGELAVVQGSYTYHHYMQDQFDDKGWGCAYRSLQTLVSWFIQQGYTSRAVPNHEEIQKALVVIGDKPSSFVGSKKWIGSSEVGYCLDHFLGLQCKFISVSSGEDLSEKGAELIYHFRNQGTPVMIGGGVLAHTILGVHYNNTGEIKFLVLDPHYTGVDDLKVIQGKGWCGWKGPNFWDKNAFYNLCLPLRPTGI